MNSEQDAAMSITKKYMSRLPMFQKTIVRYGDGVKDPLVSFDNVVEIYKTKIKVRTLTGGRFADGYSLVLALPDDDGEIYVDEKLNSLLLSSCVIEGLKLLADIYIDKIALAVEENEYREQVGRGDENPI
jgi:hypothetical protein